MPGIKRAEGHLRHLLGVFEQDIAVQIAVVRSGGPLVGGEGRELARLVKPVGKGHVFLPDGARHLRVNQLLDRLVFGQRIAEPRENSLNIGLAADLELLRDGQLADRRPGFIGQPDRTRVFRMVGHRHPVKRVLKLDGIPHGVLDRLAQRILISFFRSGKLVAKEVSIEGPTGVHVGFAEINIPERVLISEDRIGCQGDCQDE